MRAQSPFHPLRANPFGDRFALNDAPDEKLTLREKMKTVELSQCRHTFAQPFL